MAETLREDESSKERFNAWRCPVCGKHVLHTVRSGYRAIACFDEHDSADFEYLGELGKVAALDTLYERLREAEQLRRQAEQDHNLAVMARTDAEARLAELVEAVRPVIDGGYVGDNKAAWDALRDAADRADQVKE